MSVYFAPMEGLTDSIYRSLHHRFFPGIDRYYTPFLSPSANQKPTTKDSREIPPAHTLSFPVVPQILSKSSQDTLFMARHCAQLGYEEINLNLGCPSGTVTAKGKGSGMLIDFDRLDTYLYEVFAGSPIAVSVKTRIAFHHPEDFPQILEIYNRYPIRELIIHPRVRDDFYKGALHMEAFRYAAETSRAPLCFNGNLCSREDIHRFQTSYPQIPAIMLGRGLIGNPGMLTAAGTTLPALEGFCCALLEAYGEAFGSTRNAMFRMKENWRYLSCLFDGGEKLFKQLRKTTELPRYREITREIFASVPLRDALQPDW